MSLTHLSSADDLVTKPEATRAGFLALAIERNRLATPLAAQARALKVAAQSAGGVERCINDAEIRPAILAAAGVSEKGRGISPKSRSEPPSRISWSAT